MIIGIDASRANEEKKTGVGWYAYNLIQEFKKITPEDIRVVLYTNKPLQGELAKLPNGWTEKVLNWFPGRLWTQVRLSFEMLINPPDVLFIPAHVFPIIHPNKTVMTVHDIAAIKFPNSYNWFEKWYTLWSAKFAVKHLWCVITPSRFTKKELISECRMQNAECDKIVVVAHGYDKKFKIEDLRMKIDEVLERYQITKPYLLSIGRLEEKKNTVKIIQAFNLIKSNNLQSLIFNLQLVLVGQPGYGYEKVKETIDNSKFKNDIITPGWVPNDDLPDLMSGAEVFVFPSLYEGFGIPVLEAFSCGTPVLASRGSSLEEVGNDACFYVDPDNTEEIANGILKLIQDKEYRTKNIERGLERVKEFSWETCTKETLDTLLNN
ncbi:MAG TPA: hypothetical protein DEB09_04820 [Candidatus Magasanikbacteria bacterium]|nr:hypothetical protein [Candidatus Magasanikbacteria bacterium]